MKKTVANIQTEAGANNSNTATNQDIVANETVSTSNPADQNDPAVKPKLPYHQKGGYMHNGDVFVNGIMKPVEDRTWVYLFGQNRNVMDAYEGLHTIWELKAHLPFMEEKLFEQLKENIAQNGMTDPILYFLDDEGEKVVAEGHTRLMVAIELGLKDFPTKQITQTFGSLDEIKLWMIKHQFQRRNLTNAQRLKLAFLSKPLLEELAKKNNSEGGKGKKTDKPFHTSNELSKLAGVSKASVIRFNYVMENATQDTIARLMNNEISVGKAYDTVRNVNQTTPEERKLLKSLKEATELMGAEKISAYLIVKDEEQKQLLDKKLPLNIVFIMLEDVLIELESFEKSLAIAA